MRVLVTGRYGFTGHYVAEALTQAGHEVWGTGSAPVANSDPHYARADLSDPASIFDMVTRVAPDAVIHLAGVRASANGRANGFYDVNLKGTRNLLHALRQGGYAQDGVVLASSATVYGATDLSPIPEDLRPNPTDDYAESKLSMEQVSGLFSNDFPLTILRPFDYTGRGQKARNMVPKIVRQFRDRAPGIELARPDVARDISDVRDVAGYYRFFLEHPATDGPINLCSGKGTSPDEIVRTCRDLTGHDPTVARDAEARPDEAPKLQVGSTDRLNGLAPQIKRTPLRETLEWMLAG